MVNKPKRNVKLKSVTGQVHCKRKKCCAYEPFTWGPVIDFDKMKRDRLDKKCVEEFPKLKLFFGI